MCRARESEGITGKEEIVRAGGTVRILCPTHTIENRDNCMFAGEMFLVPATSALSD